MGNHRHPELTKIVKYPLDHNFPAGNLGGSCYPYHSKITINPSLHAVCKRSDKQGDGLNVYHGINPNQKRFLAILASKNLLQVQIQRNINISNRKHSQLFCAKAHHRDLVTGNGG